MSGLWEYRQVATELPPQMRGPLMFENSPQENVFGTKTDVYCCSKTMVSSQGNLGIIQALVYTLLAWRYNSLVCCKLIF